MRTALASIGLLVCIESWGCSSDVGESPSHADHAGHGQIADEDDDFKGCPEGIAPFGPGRAVQGEHFAVTVLGAMPAQPERYENRWTLELSTLDGSPVQEVEIVRGQTFMPLHGHDGRVEPEPMRLPAPGQYEVDRLNFTMRGPWEVRLWLSSVAVSEELVVIDVCVAR